MINYLPCNVSPLFASSYINIICHYYPQYYPHYLQYYIDIPAQYCNQIMKLIAYIDYVPINYYPHRYIDQLPRSLPKARDFWEAQLSGDAPQRVVPWRCVAPGHGVP